MKTLLDILSLSTDHLRKHGIENPRRQAEDLLCDLFELDRIQLYTNFERPLNSEEIEKCRHYLARRVKGEPLAYIHGKVEFYGCNIQVNRSVLIPRQETEILVDKIAHYLAKQNLTDKHLWDVCCGSGCIGIALKKRFPELTVTLSDISPEALAVAKINAETNGVVVSVVQGDLLEAFGKEKAHFVVCNPPYISEKEYQVLDKEVRDFEPRIALVGGEHGTEFYRLLAEKLPDYLYPHGAVWFEIGYQQGKSVENFFKGGFWKTKQVENDWAGHDRFFFLENE